MSRSRYQAQNIIPGQSNDLTEQLSFFSCGTPPPPKPKSNFSQSHFQSSHSQDNIGTGSSPQEKDEKCDGKRYHKRRILRRLCAAISKPANIVDPHESFCRKSRRLSKRFSLHSSLTPPSNTQFADLVSESTYDSDAEYISTPRIDDESTTLLPHMITVSRLPTPSGKNQKGILDRVEEMNPGLPLTSSFDALAKHIQSCCSLEKTDVKASAEYSRVTRNSSSVDELLHSDLVSQKIVGRSISLHNRTMRRHVHAVHKDALHPLPQQHDYFLRVLKRRSPRELRILSPNIRSTAALRTSHCSNGYRRASSSIENNAPRASRFTENFGEEKHEDQKDKSRHALNCAAIPCQQIRHITPRVGYNYRFIDQDEIDSSTSKASLAKSNLKE